MSWAILFIVSKLEWPITHYLKRGSSCHIPTFPLVARRFRQPGFGKSGGVGDKINVEYGRIQFKRCVRGVLHPSEASAAPSQGHLKLGAGSHRELAMGAPIHQRSVRLHQVWKSEGAGDTFLWEYPWGKASPGSPTSATIRCDPARRTGRPAVSWLSGLPFISVRAGWGKAGSSEGALLRAPVGMLVGLNVTECTAEYSPSQSYIIFATLVWIVLYFSIT